MMTQRIIHFPDGSNGTEAPQDGDIHQEYGRQWRYFTMPNDAGVPGVWRAADCTYIDDGPGWTLEDLKEWLGIEGIDQDDAIMRAMRVTMAFVERYCNRLFEYREHHHERLYLSKGNGWQIHLWPIKGDVYINQNHVDFQVDNQTGILWWPGYNVHPPVEAVYSGGYMPEEWPADLLMVLYNIMKNQWEMQGGGGSSLGQDISRITIPDVGTITYANGGSSSSDIGMGADFGPISQADQILLDLYRLHEC